MNRSLSWGGLAITRFLSRLRPQATYPDLPRPADPVCIIGDVHGRSDLLDRLVYRLCAEFGVSRARVILVGDLIDRGPDSAGVLHRVRDWCMRPAPFAEVECLLGNHERMLLDFLADPVAAGPRWLLNGGAETLESLGLEPQKRLAEENAAATLQRLRDGLGATLPQGMAEWLRDRPLVWREGALAVTHAGADPSRALEDQTETSLLWGHPAFRSRARSDGLWLAHGHTITPRASAAKGRIAVDTGAWRSGRLTAAWLDESGLRFVSTAKTIGS